jgi:hypothetical protein
VNRVEQDLLQALQCLHTRRGSVLLLQLLLLLWR